MNYQLIITCEHASNAIPEALSTVFFPHHSRLLRTHRGWDIGAYTVYQLLTQSIPCACISASWSRLVVDINRSVGNAQLFSESMMNVDESERTNILKRYYFPFRQHIETWINNAISAEKSVIHISIHSFTPELDGSVRTNDIGLLFDPARAREKLFVDSWLQSLEEQEKNLTTRRNYPYHGTEDGLTTYLRTRFTDANYIGIELEMNQRHFNLHGECVTQIDDAVVESFHAAIERFTATDAN